MTDSPSRVVRAALTQTVNAYPGMPSRLEDLSQLAEELDAVRRANLDHHVELLEAAHTRGARVACMGELFAAPYFALGHDPMWTALAEDACTGPSVTRMRETAARLSMILVAPIYELDPSGRRFNTAVVIDENGEVLGTFKKAHIPHGENEQGAFLEGFYYERSDGKNATSPSNVSSNSFFPVFETSIGRLGIAICYDRHFEGVMSALAREGAELVFCPAATFGPKSQRMWHLEFPVDAARHRLFIGACNRKGTEPPWNQPYFGESYFCGPAGVVPDVSDHPNLILADVDLGELSRPDPSGWDLPRDRRLDIYR